MESIGLVLLISLNFSETVICKLTYVELYQSTTVFTFNT